MEQWYHVLEIYEASQLNAKQFLSSGWCGICSTRIFFHTRIVMMWKMFYQMYNPCFLSYPDRSDFRIKTITSKLHSRYDCVGTELCRPPTLCSPCPFLRHIMRYKWCHVLKKNISSQLLNSVQNSSFQMVQWYHVLQIYEASQLNAKQFLSSGWCGECSIRVFFHTRIVLILVFKNYLKTSFQVPVCRHGALQRASILQILSTIPETSRSAISFSDPIIVPNPLKPNAGWPRIKVMSSNVFRKHFKLLNSAQNSSFQVDGVGSIQPVFSFIPGS